MNLGRKVIKVLLLAINIFVALLMILGMVAAGLSPEQVLLPAYVSLVLPFIVLFNVLFVLLWLFFRKWAFFISLVVLIIGFNHVRNAFPVNFKGKDKEVVVGQESFTLLTYNTHANYLLAKHTEKHPNPVIQYMLDKDPDILCIQEYSASNNETYLTRSDLLQIFRKYPYHFIKFKIDQGWSQFGTATFSKYPIVNSFVIDYESQFNTGVCTDIEINGKVMRLFNCHLESNKLTENDKIMALRLRENLATDNIKGTTLYLSRKLGAAYRIRAKQADYVAARIADSPYPVMVAGDFNDVPSSYAYTKVRGNMDDAFVENGFGLGWTFNESIFRFRIDHILYQPDFEIVDFLLDDKVKASDHYPLFCKVRFK